MGVWLISAALAGYFTTRLSAMTRLLFAAAGLLALIPAGAFSGAIFSDIIGITAGAVLMAREGLRGRRAALQTEVGT